MIISRLFEETPLITSSIIVMNLYTKAFFKGKQLKDFLSLPKIYQSASSKIDKNRKKKTQTDPNQSSPNSSNFSLYFKGLV